MSKKGLVLLAIGLMIIILAVCAYNVKSGASKKSDAEIEEITPEAMINYPVSNFTIVDKNEKLVKVFFEKNGQEGFVQLYFDKVSVTEYYSQKNQNTLNGEKMLELQGINLIRFSPDLDKDIRQALFN